MSVLRGLRRRLLESLPEHHTRRLVQLRHGETDLQRRLTAWLPRRKAPAAEVTSFDALEIRAATVQAVTATLTAAAVPFAVIPGPGGSVKAIAVPERERAAIWRELARGLSGPGWLYLPHRGSRRGHGVDKPKRMRSTGAAPTGGARIYRAMVAPNREPIPTAELGCDLEFWSETVRDNVRRSDGGTHPVGTWISPRPKASLPYLAAEQWHTATARGSHSIDPVPYRGIFELNEPVDLVYTWVDGTDPDWLARRHAVGAGPTADEINESADHPSRFLSRDELRYSLRSVAMYASWVRRIFIVTDRQVPPWLDATHDKITVVDHTEIFNDTSVLPVFNSHAIESQLHHIPGLAEHYLYLNDDFFFGRPVTPSTFFHGNGIAKFFLSTSLLDRGPRSKRDLPVLSAAKQVRHLLERDFGVTIETKLKHTPKPQLRSMVEDLEKTYPEIFEQTAASRLRHPDDYSIPSALVQYYAYLRGRAVPGEIAYRYQDIGRPNTRRWLDGLLRLRDADVFCLNDNESDLDSLDAQYAGLQWFFQRYFPIPSPFELADR